MLDPGDEWKKYVDSVHLKSNHKSTNSSTDNATSVTAGAMDQNGAGTGAGPSSGETTGQGANAGGTGAGPSAPSQPQSGSSWRSPSGMFAKFTSSIGLAANGGSTSSSAHSGPLAGSSGSMSIASFLGGNPKAKTKSVPLIDLPVDTNGTKRLMAQNGIVPQTNSHQPIPASPPFNVASHALHTFVTQEVLAVSTFEVDDENCGICMFLLKESGMFDPDEDEYKTERRYGVLNKCNHRFHSACLSELMSKTPTYVQCPVCKVIYGVKHGTQPRAGTMTSRTLKTQLAGYEADPECLGTIEIMYNFHTGVQEEGNPSPGQRYDVVAFPRVAYLPATPKGHTVHKLLKRAFDQRVTFTIGTSSTSGLANVITWNDIHHKTQLRGPYGYPDEYYLDRVLLELAQHGIFEDDKGTDHNLG